jgi:hypothetical protein
MAKEAPKWAMSCGVMFTIREVQKNIADRY